VLLVLVQNGSQLTTKEELMSRVWGDSFVEDANLTVTISALRRCSSPPAVHGSRMNTSR
jgi:DNA-binding winged helix-turn-helix (wHTH) protein